MEKITMSYGIIIWMLLFYFSSASATEEQNNKFELANILGSYWSWWTNSPEDAPENNPKCSMHINANDSFIFLMNPFETGNTTFDCSDEPIPEGYSILFPLITSFCSQGDGGYYGSSYEEIRSCALDLDRGLINGIVSINGKEVVNIIVNNGDGVSTKPILNNKLPLFHNYRNILSKQFVDLIVTKNTTIPNNWEKPEEFENNPVHYKAVVHCECIIINSTELREGTNMLKYTADSTGGKSSINLSDKGWRSQSITTYKFMVR
jgi:hypothetical protein